MVVWVNTQKGQLFPGGVGLVCLPLELQICHIILEVEATCEQTPKSATCREGDGR